MQICMSIASKVTSKTESMLQVKNSQNLIILRNLTLDCI